MELCTIPEGQFMRKQVPSDKIKEILGFSAKSPSDRKASILEAMDTLAYNQSDYVNVCDDPLVRCARTLIILQQFGMHVDDSSLLPVKARILAAPTLKFADDSQQPTVVCLTSNLFQVGSR